MNDRIRAIKRAFAVQPDPQIKLMLHNYKILSHSRLRCRWRCDCPRQMYIL